MTIDTLEPKKKLIIAVTIPVFVLLIFIAAAALIIFSNKFTLDLTLHGEADITLEYGEKYVEQGAEAEFYGTVFVKEAVPLEVTVSGAVNDVKVGSYTVTYSARYIFDYYIGSKEYTKSVTRTVKVVDTVAPVIKLEYIPGAYTLPGQPYKEEGYSASDNYDGDVTVKVVSYERDGKVYYSVSDAQGNRAEAVRDIFYDDPIPPELKLLGDGDIVIAEGGTFKDPGYIAADNVDGDISDRVTVEGTVDTSKKGKYTLTYTVADNYENVVCATRDVNVKSKEEQPEPEEGKEHEVLKTAPLNPNGKVIYLTFDDGPGAHTARLLDVLKKYDVKATFFVVNTGYLDILPRMKEEGHTIAMHTATHDYDTIYSSDEAYFEDLAIIENAIKDKIGEFTKILRFPGGGSNNISKNLSEGIMTRLTDKVKEMGYRYYDWNVDSNDAGGTKTAEGVYNNVINGVQNCHYSVVLQHDINGYSVDAVEKIIIWGLENGYTFKPLTANSPICEHTVKN